MPNSKILIGGEWRGVVSGETITVINPSTGEVFSQIGRGDAADIDLAVTAAQSAFDGDWGHMPGFERGRLLMKLREAILDNFDVLTDLEVADVGKPAQQSRNDVAACARYFEFYGGAADKIHGETIPYLEGYTVMTLREAHGVTGHIIPWNYPMQIIGRSIGAALTMGNACVLKPGEDASLTSLKIGELAMQAGFPAGALNIVTGLGSEAGAALSAHPGIRHISFTGSTGVGTLIQKAAAENTIPVTLELGGKSPQIVFADADLDAAVPFLTNAIVQNSGQTCSAGSRLLVQQTIHDELLEKVAEGFKAMVVGPADRNLNCGPMVNKKQLDKVQSYLAMADGNGPRIVAQAKMDHDLPEGGYYVAPTLIADVPPDHPLAQEEIFGPVLSVISFKDEDDAIAIANGTKYGLVAGVWTRDGARQMRMARDIQAGQIFVNNYGAGGGVELPFGGVKGSGFGREKGFEALNGFSTTKTIAIKHD